MSNYDLEEVKLVKIQISLTLISILTIIISLYLSYDAIKELQKEEKIFDDNTTSNLLKINRTIGTIIALCFLLINIYDKNIKVKYEKDLEDADIQIWSSVLTLVAALMVLYVSFDRADITTEENPLI